MAERVYRVKEKDLLRTGIIDGNIYACTDTRKLYQDVGSKRLILSAIQISTDKKRIHDTVPQTNTKYYVWETNELWLWKNAWVKLLGNPDYPDAYQYIDGDLYAVGGRGTNTFVDNNGLLGDGGVAVRDINRVIKGKMYIDDSNDNLVLASFLGGGIKFLPNGNMEETGAFYLDVDEKGTGLHYNDLYNVNGELFVQYDEENRGIDPAIYPKSSHTYSVWHEGNLDATPLINDELLRKYYEMPNNEGSTLVDNSSSSNGFKVLTKNNDLETNAGFLTFNYWSNSTPVLNEIYIESQLDPNQNARIFGAKSENNDYSFYLSYDSNLPTNSRDLNDLERLLNKGEIEQLINNKIRIAVIESVTSSYCQYKISEEGIERFLKDGFVILIRFATDPALDGIKINVNDSVTYEIDDNVLQNQKPLFFKAGNVYQFVINGSKLILLNSDIIANQSKYGNVKMTNNDEHTAESFGLVTGTDVNLNDPRFRVEGNFAFRDMLSTKTGFPEEESSSDRQTASYVLSVKTAIDPSNVDNFQQILTNINESRIYKRSYNTAYYLKDEFERGQIDSNGNNADSLIHVRERYFHEMKNSQNLAISTDLPNNVQFKVTEYNDFDKITESTWRTANQAYIFTTNIRTKFIRMSFRYSDGSTQLRIEDVQNANIKIQMNGFSQWEKMYPVDNKFLKSERFTINHNYWENRQDGCYEYTIKRNFVSPKTLVEGSLDLVNKDKLESSYIESFVGGFKIVTKLLPREDFIIDITYQETNEVEVA